MDSTEIVATSQVQAKKQRFIGKGCKVWGLKCPLPRFTFSWLAPSKLKDWNPVSAQADTLTHCSRPCDHTSRTVCIDPLAHGRTGDTSELSHSTWIFADSFLGNISEQWRKADGLSPSFCCGQFIWRQGHVPFFPLFLCHATWWRRSSQRAGASRIQYPQTLDLDGGIPWCPVSCKVGVWHGWLLTLVRKSLKWLNHPCQLRQGAWEDWVKLFLAGLQQLPQKAPVLSRGPTVARFWEPGNVLHYNRDLLSAASSESSESDLNCLHHLFHPHVLPHGIEVHAEVAGASKAEPLRAQKKVSTWSPSKKSPSTVLQEFDGPSIPLILRMAPVWGVPEIGVPHIFHPFSMGFSLLNHPFLGTPIYGNPHLKEILGRLGSPDIHTAAHP